MLKPLCRDRIEGYYTGYGHAAPTILSAERECEDPRSAPLLMLVDLVTLAETYSVYPGDPTARQYHDRLVHVAVGSASMSDF